MSLESVRTYATAWEAGIAKSLLEAEGIPALADDTSLAGVTGLFYSNSPIGYHVRVDSAFLDRAREVLRDWEENSEPLTEKNGEPEPPETQEPSGESPEGSDAQYSDPKDKDA